MSFFAVDGSLFIYITTPSNAQYFDTCIGQVVEVENFQDYAQVTFTHEDFKLGSTRPTKIDIDLVEIDGSWLFTLVQPLCAQEDTQQKVESIPLKTDTSVEHPVIQVSDPPTPDVSVSNSSTLSKDIEQTTTIDYETSILSVRLAIYRMPFGGGSTQSFRLNIPGRNSFSKLKSELWQTTVVRHSPTQCAFIARSATKSMSGVKKIKENKGAYWLNVYHPSAITMGITPIQATLINQSDKQVIVVPFNDDVTNVHPKVELTHYTSSLDTPRVEPVVDKIESTVVAKAEFTKTQAVESSLPDSSTTFVVSEEISKIEETKMVPSENKESASKGELDLLEAEVMKQGIITECKELNRQFSLFRELLAKNSIVGVKVSIEGVLVHEPVTNLTLRESVYLQGLNAVLAGYRTSLNELSSLANDLGFYLEAKSDFTWSVVSGRQCRG